MLSERLRIIQLRRTSRLPGVFLFGEELQIDGIGHDFVAGVIGMEMVTAIGDWDESRGIVRIARGSVEINDGIEPAARANPLVDRLTSALGSGGRIGRAAEGKDRSPVDLYMVGVGAQDELLIGTDHVASKRIEVAIGFAGTDIVDAFENHEPTDA